MKPKPFKIFSCHQASPDNREHWIYMMEIGEDELTLTEHARRVLTIRHAPGLLHHRLGRRSQDRGNALLSAAGHRLGPLPGRRSAPQAQGRQSSSRRVRGKNTAQEPKKRRRNGLSDRRARGHSTPRSPWPRVQQAPILPPQARSGPLCGLRTPKLGVFREPCQVAAAAANEKLCVPVGSRQLVLAGVRCLQQVELTAAPRPPRTPVPSGGFCHSGRGRFNV
jgi:hypothetical protein